MSGLLDGGIQAVFGAAFSGIYLDGELLHSQKVDDGQGGWTESHTSTPVKLQQEQVTQAMREAAGYSDKDIALIVLQDGIETGPTTADRIKIVSGPLAGTTWNVAGPITADPGSSHWLVRGTPAR